MRRLVLALALAGACVRPTPPVLAAPGTQVAAAIVRADPETTEPVVGPEPLIDGVVGVFTDRGLTPRIVDGAALPDLFDGAPGSSLRVARLEAWAPEADLAVLVETDTLYVSQLAGRYRWEVRVVATVRDLDVEEADVQARFTVPVFLQFYREREEAAVAAATVTIRRRLGELLDDVLAARQGR